MMNDTRKVEGRWLSLFPLNSQISFLFLWPNNKTVLDLLVNRPFPKAGRNSSQEAGGGKPSTGHSLYLCRLVYIVSIVVYLDSEATTINPVGRP
jgi:hypothetical protein